MPKRLLLLIPGALALVAVACVQQHPDWAEAYSTVVYPALSSVVGFLPALVPFSVAEWVTAAFLLFCVGYVVWCIRAVVVAGGRGALRPPSAAASQAGAECAQESGAKDGRLATSVRPYPRIRARLLALYRGVVGALAVVSVVYCLFVALCGINYYRYTFAELAGFQVQQSSTEELVQLCDTLAGKLGQTRAELGEDAQVVTASEDDFTSCAQYAVAAMQTLAEQYPKLERPFYSTPKPVVLSGLMSDAGIAGMFFPFTAESNVNDDIPLFTMPSTMAHELAHQCGFMREDEANFIAYLACMRSDDALVRYSGLYLAFVHSVNALSRVDAQAAADVIGSLPQAVQHDMRANNQFWAEHEGALSDVSEATNDAYLKANSQTSGTASYGRMVDLLLAEQRAGA